MDGEKIAALAARVRAARPTVQCIPSNVSGDLMDSVLRAAGAVPLFATSLNEADEVAETTADALLINASNVTSAWIAAKSLAIAGASAAAASPKPKPKKPWVLDPVGCGATPRRRASCAALLALRPDVVRGNASEVLALAGRAGGGRGVDSTVGSRAALGAAVALARRNGCVVAISGAVDLITDGARVLGVANGRPLMQQVTATGCSLTALVAAYLAVAARPDDSGPPVPALEATAAALAVFGLAGEMAEAAIIDALPSALLPSSAAAAAGTPQSRVGPGSLRVALIDALARAAGGDGAEIAAGACVREEELPADCVDEEASP